MSLQDNNKKGCLAHPIWTVIGTIATILTFAFAIFVWLFPDVHTLIPNSSTTPITRSPLPIVTSTPDSGSPLNPGSNHRIASNKRLAFFLVIFKINGLFHFLLDLYLHLLYHL